MLKTILPDQMQALERTYMAETGITGQLLMEHAAQGVAAALAARIGHGRVLFLCGPGNNGGDGYAAARLWRGRGHEALIWELTATPRGDAAVQRRLASSAGISVETLTEMPSALPPCAAVVDALFGTGLDRAVTGLAAELIALVNRSGLPVIAVDIPSGLNGTTGQAAGAVVRAVETVTFHRLKEGLVSGIASDVTGALTVWPILMPADEGEFGGLSVMTPDDLQTVLPPRDRLAHKGNFGRVVILAGSVGMAGAAAMCARACVKAGAGLVTLLCREMLWPVLQTLVPTAMCIPLTVRAQEMTPEALRQAEEAIRRADRVVVGCGLSTAPDMLPLLRMLRTMDKPVVWDADALNLLAGHPDLLPLRPCHVITPHFGEAARLLNITAAEAQADPVRTLMALSRRCGCAVLLKGTNTLMTDGFHRAVNAVGTPALARGGSGDVLSGLLGALLGLVRATPEEAVLTAMQTAALMHALAALAAAEQTGEAHMTMEALIDHIGQRPMDCRLNAPQNTFQVMEG